MKILTASLMSELPEKVIPHALVSNLFGYTIWRKSVIQQCGSYGHEIVRFEKLRAQGICDKVAQVTQTFNQLHSLLMFMQEHELDVIFTDGEAED